MEFISAIGIRFFFGISRILWDSRKDSSGCSRILRDSEGFLGISNEKFQNSFRFSRILWDSQGILGILEQNFEDSFIFSRILWDS